ncbi:MAG: sulfite exporter TauE/SafE family protein [Roseibium sp.]
MSEPVLFILFCLIFMIAGIVKGLVGFGMPAISLGLLTILVGVDKAIVIILWPALLTNVWQASLGGHLRVLLARLWPFLLAAMLTLWFGTFILTKLPDGGADLVLGVLMVAYAVPLLAGITFFIPERLQMPVGIIVGAVNGVFSGLTGTYAVPGMMYLQSIGLSRDALIQAMGLLFMLSTVTLWAALGSFGMVRASETFLSMQMVVPAFVGVWLGLVIRRRLSDAGFRSAVLIVILAMGLYLVPLGIVRLAS